MRLHDHEEQLTDLAADPAVRQATLLSLSPLGLLLCDADGRLTAREGGPWARAGLADVETLADLTTLAPRLAGIIHRATGGTAGRETLDVSGRVWEVEATPWHGGAIVLALDRGPVTASAQPDDRSNGSLDLLAEGSAEGLWMWETASDQIWTSRRLKAMLDGGEDFAEGGLARWLEHVHPEDVAGIRTGLDRLVEGSVEVFELEARLRHSDGRYLWMRARAVAERDADGRALRVGGSLADLTEYKRSEERLAWQAWHDPLTGLPNRAFFLDRLRLTMERARRQPALIWAVLFIDLDRFKIVNDSLGHLAGDELLRGMARRIESCLRSTDCVARFGGDEFAILVDDLGSEDEAEHVAERLLSELSEPFVLEGTEIVATASIGIAHGSTAYTQPAQLLRDADSAMYHAKHAGRARWSAFSPDMHQRAVAALHLESQLRRAVERTELENYYQPIFDLATGKLAGFEALVRWNHDDHGLMSPAQFLSLAEETGLIVPLGEHVLDKAIACMNDWRQRIPAFADAHMSVNLSPRQFAMRELPSQVRTLLDRRGLPPGALKLEITESVLMDNADHAFAMFMRLRALGVKLAIDDFGTGFSSLSYLHRFPMFIHTLKIDQSFVSRMHIEVEKAEIVRTIAMLARNLDLEIVAEGIEHADHVQQIRALGANLGQGFFFGRPLPAAEIESRWGGSDSRVDVGGPAISYDGDHRP
jgi:diguanylate cyclase (GGDEF)-like protein